MQPRTLAPKEATFARTTGSNLSRMRPEYTSLPVTMMPTGRSFRYGRSSMRGVSDARTSSSAFSISLTGQTSGMMRSPASFMPFCTG